MNKKGFTLLELLIAATILATLAVFATVSYQRAMADVRIEDGKNRTRVVAAAIERMQFEHPKWAFSSRGGADSASRNALRKLDTVRTCGLPYFSVGSGTVDGLINCGYLENRVWSDAYVLIEPCTRVFYNSLPSHTGICGNPEKNLPKDRLVCMSGNPDNDKLPAKYQYDNGYRFCVKSGGEEIEVFN